MYVPLLATELPTIHLAYAGVLALVTYLAVSGRWREFKLASQRRLAVPAPCHAGVETDSRDRQLAAATAVQEAHEDHSLLADLLQICQSVRMAVSPTGTTSTHPKPDRADRKNDTRTTSTSSHSIS